MKKIFHFKVIIYTAIVASSITVSNYIQQEYLELILWQSIIILIIITLSSYLISDILTSLILKIDFFRKIVCGKEYIDGYWYLETSPKKDDDDLDEFPGDGIAYISRRGSEYELKTVTTRMKKSGELYRVISITTYIEEGTPNTNYLNAFYSSDDLDKRTGMAHGEFLNTDSKRMKYDGKFTPPNSKISYKQSGWKIHPKEYKQLRKSLGDDWQKTLIIHKGNIQKAINSSTS